MGAPLRSHLAVKGGRADGQREGKEDLMAASVSDPAVFLNTPAPSFSNPFLGAGIGGQALGALFGAAAD